MPAAFHMYLPNSHSGANIRIRYAKCMSLLSLDRSYSGQVGYIMLGMRNSREAHIGDTFHHTGIKVTPLPGFRSAKPMVIFYSYHASIGRFNSLAQVYCTIFTTYI